VKNQMSRAEIGLAKRKDKLAIKSKGNKSRRGIGMVNLRRGIIRKKLQGEGLASFPLRAAGNRMENGRLRSTEEKWGVRKLPSTNTVTQVATKRSKRRTITCPAASNGVQEKPTREKAYWAILQAQGKLIQVLIL